MSTSSNRAGQITVLLVAVVSAVALTYAAVSQRWLTEPEPAAVQPVMSDKPLFKTLDKMVVGLSGDRVQRYMMLELALVSRDPRMEAQSESLTPVIYNAVLQYFAQHTYEAARAEIQDIEKLQNRLLEKVQATTAGYGYQLAVDKLLLTKVVIQ